MYKTVIILNVIKQKGYPINHELFSLSLSLFYFFGARFHRWLNNRHDRYAFMQVSTIFIGSDKNHRYSSH